MTMRLKILIGFLATFLINGCPVQADNRFRCAGKPIATTEIRQSHTEGSRRALAIFARFRDQGSATVPDWADEIFDPNRPGSFSHFYDSMSLGKLQVRGEIAPRVYTSEQQTVAYLADDSTRVGEYGQLSLEILRQVDAEVDFSQYDNDGPDGIPGSGDDDGFVDALFIIVASTPPNFVMGAATGVAGLGFGKGTVDSRVRAGNFFTEDRSADGKRVFISPTLGTIQQGRNLTETVGSMCHEYGHVLGLPDLYDIEFVRRQEAPPEEDSAGIGSWGLMGWGGLGWSGSDGPNGMCAFSRQRLGWAQVVEPEQLVEEMRLEDVGENGMVYKVPLTRREYFLVEYRRRATSYYDRAIPGEGLLIWHVERTLPQGEISSRWLVDLECADGRWRDAGYPLGREEWPVDGRDNLDFWAHDREYAELHEGNLGDATDPFDGVEYRAFTPETNPSARSSDGTLEVRLENFRIEGGLVYADVKANPPQLELLHLTVGSELAAVGVPVPVVFDLANRGGMRATGLRARLRSDDPLVEIIDADIPLIDLDIEQESLGGAINSDGYPQIRFLPGLVEEREATIILEVYASDQLLIEEQVTLKGVPSFLVSGAVKGETGESVGGVSIQIEGSSEIYIERRMTTDEDGFFQTYLPSGFFDISVQPDPESDWLEVTRSGIWVQEETELEFILPRAYVLSGVIRDPEGVPVEGHRLRLSSLDGGNSYIARTKTDGSYHVKLPGGDYIADAFSWVNTGTWFPSQVVGGIRIEGDTVLDVDLELGFPLKLHAVDEEGMDVEGVQFYIYSQDDIYGSSHGGVTREDGLGETQAMPGKYGIRLEAVPAPYLLQEGLTVEVERDTTIQIVLRKGILLKGRLLDDAGGEIRYSRGWMYFYPLLGGISYQVELDPEEDGFSVGLEPGGYRVEVSFSWFQGSPYEAIPSQNLGEIEVLGEENEIDFTIQRGVTLGGKVQSESGELVGNTAITFSSLEGGNYWAYGSVLADGTYQVALLPGIYRVQLSSGGNFPPQDLGEIEVGEENGEINFVVREGVAFGGRVVDEDGTAVRGGYLYCEPVGGSGWAYPAIRSNGSFQVNLLPGIYRVQMSGWEDFPSQTLGEIEVKEEGGEANLVVRKGVKISGQVLDKEGWRVSDGYLFFDPVNGGDGFGASFGQDGNYSTSLFRDRYRVRVNFGAGENTPPSQDLGILEVEEELEYDWIVDWGEIFEGRIVDAEGEAVSGLNLFAQIANQGISGTGVTGADGNFSLRLIPGEYWFSLYRNRKNSYTSWNLGKIDLSTGMRIDRALPSGAVVRGKIEAGEGKPVREVSLRFVREPRRSLLYDQENWLAQLVVDEDGGYEIELMPGEYSLLAYKDKLGRVVAEVQVVGELELDVILPATEILHSLSGKVRRQEQESPVQGFIQFYDANQGVAGWGAIDEGEYETELPPGSYWVTIIREEEAGMTKESQYGPLEISSDQTWNVLLSPDGTPVLEETGTIPMEFGLLPNYPNPFNSATTIRFSLPEREEVELAVFNLAGQQVARLVDGPGEAGVYSLIWDGRDSRGWGLASGVYLYRLRAGQREETRKLLLVK